MTELLTNLVLDFTRSDDDSFKEIAPPLIRAPTVSSDVPLERDPAYQFDGTSFGDVNGSTPGTNISDDRPCN